MAKAPTSFETPFDVYSVRSVIGEGGCGQVFAVIDTDGNEWAIKCLRPDVLETSKRKRFKNEIDFCTKQRHANILEIRDSGRVVWDSKSTTFYVMPRFIGTLRDFLGTNPAPNLKIRAFAQMLDGVEAAHSFDVVHRDLKPENVLWDGHNRFVIADFGIARFTEDQMASFVETKPADRLLNVKYAAPEQLERGHEVDQRADIFALGLILNEMFTGVVPRGSDYASVASVATDFSYLDDIVRKMIQHRSTARPSNIREVQEFLIGHRNEFVARQRLDELRNKVIPANSPRDFAPIEHRGTDWADGDLIFQLDREPPNEWQNIFRQPRANYPSVHGSAPHNFRFQAGAARVRADANSAKQIASNFTRYLEMTNRAHADDLKMQAEAAESEERQKLREAIRQQERRAEILRALNE